MTEPWPAPGDPGPQRSADRTEQERPREQSSRQRTILLGRALEPGGTERIAAEVLSLARDDSLTDIVLLIESVGGPVQAGLDLVDVIGSVGCDVATYATGLISDMGLLVLAAGARGKRHAFPQARLVLRRPPDARVMRRPPPDAAERFPDDRGMRSALREVALVTAERTGRGVERVLADMRAERSFGPEEALAYGFVDEVVHQRKPLGQKPPDRDRDADGGTLLHQAYYAGDWSAVEALLARGADAGLRNRFGLTPPLMAEVRTAESQLLDLAGLVHPSHSWGHIGPPAYPGVPMPDRTWTDSGSAAGLCALLRGHDPDVYAFALARAVRVGEPRAVLRSAIKVGRPESLDQLEALLDRYGTAEIATDYLNCGSRGLADAGRRWAREHRYEIQTWFGGGGPGRWGTG
ncbi:ATP-dependent Clp protease proteolytic subunit [Nonomuraea sp. NPDC004186]